MSFNKQCKYILPYHAPNGNYYLSYDAYKDSQFGELYPRQYDSKHFKVDTIEVVPTKSINELLLLLN